MFLPFIGITFASLALFKLGALTVMVSLLSSVISALLVVILALVVLLGWRHVIKKP